MDMPVKFNTNEDPEITVTRVGELQTPVLVVDDFLQNVDELISMAGDVNSFSGQGTDYYPGVRKPLDKAYEQMIQEWVKYHLASHLTDNNAAVLKHVDINLAALSLTNQAPESLVPIQRIPHFDTTNPNQWALVHYLCGPEFGGTGFFKHKRSGFETITEKNQKAYFRNLADDASVKGVPDAKYLQGSNDLFEMLHYVEAKKNRMVIYPSNLLHSGLIKKWQAPTPQQGRLTANAFCVVTT
ncbi:hypothetical protein FM019_04950 [Aliiglaciecola sp. M165]|nr:hypothetical protein FM019_04950 [Aliiglaciecola sp. M165]